MKRRPRHCFLYVAVDGDLTKIGVSNNTKRRRWEMGRPSKDYDEYKFDDHPEIVWRRYMPKNSVRVESAIKERFAHLTPSPSYSEWFKITIDEMLAAIAEEHSRC